MNVLVIIALPEELVALGLLALDTSLTAGAGPTPGAKSPSASSSSTIERPYVMPEIKDIL